MGANRTVNVLLYIVLAAVFLLGAGFSVFGWAIGRLPPAMEWALEMSSEQIAELEPRFLEFSLALVRFLGATLLAIAAGCFVLVRYGEGSPAAARAVFLMLALLTGLTTISLLAAPFNTPWIAWAVFLILTAVAYGFWRRARTG